MVTSRMAARYRAHLPLLPGAVQAVERLSAHWPLGLASSAPLSLIDTVLNASALRPYFAVAMSTEQVTGRADPDIYLAVAAKLGQPAARCAAVEDSANGLRSAASAGCQVIAVPRPRYPPGDEALGLAGVVLGSLTELTAEVVRDLS